jgi:hypothetical protein
MVNRAPSECRYEKRAWPEINGAGGRGTNGERR